MSKNLIDGLPESLRESYQHQHSLLYQQAQRLYLVGSRECVHHIAEKMNFPKFINESVLHSVQVGCLDITIKGVSSKMPIQADIQFFRRPQDNMIVAIAACCSLIYHRDIFEDGVIKLLPKVAKDKRENLYWDSSVESNFFYWCEEVVKTRKDYIDEALASM